MDDVERLLRAIRDDTSVARTRFTASFLNDLAEVYERHGPGVAHTYLLDKRGRGELRFQADAALRVLSIMASNARVATDRRVGRLIIKTLVEIVREGH